MRITDKKQMYERGKAIVQLRVERKLEIPTQNLELANTLRSTISSAAEKTSTQSIRGAKDAVDWQGLCCSTGSTISSAALDSRGPQPLPRSPQMIWLHFHKACLQCGRASSSFVVQIIMSGARVSRICAISTRNR